MATFIDEDENKTEADQFDTLNEQPVQDVVQEDSPQEQPSEEEDDDIPEKYKGKSVKEIVRMHQEAEKAMGKQGSEVGELRRLVDDFIRAQSVTKQQAPEVVDEVDFFEDPNKAVQRAIETHPKIKQAEQFAAQMRRAEALNNLKAAHPDFNDIVQDQSFVDWVKNSRVRQELFVRADQNFDIDAASELFNTWKERKGVINQTAEVEKANRQRAVKSASTGSGKGSGETTSRKTYRRADIIELMQRDPDRYQALAPEIMQAYAEGRVK